MDYKKYSLENLENWLNDAMSSGEATPQEIYDTIKKVVEEERTYHTQRAAKTSELLSLLNGHKPINLSTFSPGVIDFTNLGATDTITFTSCDSTNTSPECSQHWSSFWNDQYQTPKDTQYVNPKDAINNLAFTQVGDFTVHNNSTKDSFTSITSSPFVSEDGDVWKTDKVTKWVLPVELDGLTGDCVVTLPDDLLERVGWVEGDTVEFVSNTNGSFTVKKVVKSEV